MHKRESIEFKITQIKLENSAAIFSTNLLTLLTFVDLYQPYCNIFNKLIDFVDLCWPLSTLLQYFQQTYWLCWPLLTFVNLIAIFSTNLLTLLTFVDFCQPYCNIFNKLIDFVESNSILMNQSWQGYYVVVEHMIS